MLVVADVPLDPREIARRLCRSGHDEELGGPEPDDGEVALEAAARVEHRRVDHPPDGYVDFVRAQSLQECERVAALQHEFAERRLVEHDDVLAAGTLLFEHVRQPARRAEGVRRSRRARGRK